MSGPIDVLDVPTLIAEMRRQAAQRNATWPCILLKNLVPLLDHVAEMVEADREYDAAYAAVGELRDGVSTIGEVIHAEAALHRAQSRRATALARVGGAS